MNIQLSSSELKSFFYGTLLGDSYIHHSGGTFCCKQITEDLIDFKMAVIKKHLPDAKVIKKMYPGSIDSNGVVRQPSYELVVSYSEYIKKLFPVFYSNGKKIYPINAIKNLTPLGFAMWYADDGTTVLVGKNQNTGSANSRRIQICTDNFSLEENNQIKEELVQKGYDAKTVDRKRNGQFRIEIRPPAGQKLFLELEQYFYYFPEMLYKLDMGYRNKSLQYRRYVSEEYEALYSRVSAHPQFKDRMIGR